MSDILCRWLNVELRLSKTVDPRSISKDFANGYLIGEVLHKYQLQGDFDLFLKSNTANSKLNNFTLMEPTLQLLGVSLDLSMAQAVMREQHGAATRLLYQLFILLQKKRKAGLTGTAMEAMQPAATAFLHRVENDIYSEVSGIRLPHVCFIRLLSPGWFSREIYDKSVMAHFVEEQRRQKVQEEMRLQDIEKHRHARRKQHEMMTRIQTAVIQIPKPPPNRTLKALEKQQQNRKKQEAQVKEECLYCKLGQANSGIFLSIIEHFTTQFLNNFWDFPEYIQKIRQRLEEDATARQQREKRRRHVLVEQLKAHEAQEEALREEQLVERLTRQSQLERRLAVQLMQLRQQKDVLRQNRVFRERQYQEQRLRDFQEALEREAALARQASLDHAEDTRKEIEVHDRIATERAQARYRKHSDSCREILEQIVDLATKAGEYRLLTGNLIPGKLMREWKELMFCGKPLYDSGSLEELPADPTPEQFIEVEKQEILNNQDYDEYMSMTGEWTWPEEGETKPPPSNNNILGHVVLRLQTIVNPPKPDTLPPFFPRFTLKACVLGKLFSGKTTCLTRIAKEFVRMRTCIRNNKEHPSQLSVRAQHGAAVEKFLRKGRSVPDELLVDIAVEAIRAIPADSGWILDGFPVDLTQAKLLEKALGGSDTGKERKRRNKRSNLSVDSNAPKEPPPPSPVLDLALLLDVSDDHSSDLVGAGEESCAPAREHNVVIARDKSLEKRQIQHRITAFQDTWPKLEKWFSGKQSILMRLNAEMSEDMLFRKVESILYQAMMQSEKGTGTLSIASSFENSHGVTTSPTEPLAPTPGTTHWVYVDEPLPKEIPEYLVPYWENVCNSYVTNVKAVMQNLRTERILIIHHLEEFKQYLRRPDLKQEFVSQWQQNYNSIPKDMRDDEETKAELHQRLDDLRERLWDICDKRKEEAGQERAAIMCDGWLEDHTAVLINHFSTLIQVEVDRFQDSLRLLRDYYTGMYKQVLSEAAPEFTCIPLLDIVALEEPGNQTDKSKRQAEGCCSGEGIRPDSSKIPRVYSLETILNQMEANREGPIYICPPSPAQEPSPPPAPEEDSEEVCKRAIRNKIRQEYAAALDHEDSAVKVRVELVKACALCMVRVLHRQAEQAFRTMEEWLGARFLSEMNSIDQLAEVVRHHIESAAKLQSELMLVCTDFFLNGDVRVVVSPPNPPRPAPLELPTDSTLTILQLEAFYRQLRKVAPTGLTDFWEILQEITSLNMGTNALPDPWMHISESQLVELVSMLTQNTEMLDWRQFLLSAALPWPTPTLPQLLQVLARFKMEDTGATGSLTEEQYLKVELWFPSERALPIPEDLSEPLPYDRLANLRKFFFLLFADPDCSPARVDYVTMLLYFAAHPDPTQGFVRALSVVMGQPLRHQSSSRLLKVGFVTLHPRLHVKQHPIPLHSVPTLVKRSVLYSVPTLVKRTVLYSVPTLVKRSVLYSVPTLVKRTVLYSVPTLVKRSVLYSVSSQKDSSQQECSI
uniref:Calponin-homology (CH) domain-containing protein n=1 Tax=Oncorhynchus tshawytscha TaxID=74940 RepID=A0A8C8DAP6_ONCTS